MRFPVKGLLVFVITVAVFFSCKKESFTTNKEAVLKPSVDTLHFDTVFTTTGSVTQFVKLINNNPRAIRINSVTLSGGATSPFKINVDGISGPLVSDIEIAANDSVYIFVTVSINPTAATLPFIVQDSIEIAYNGNKDFIQLDALGRNAHFFRNKLITASEVWNNELPYVILGRLTVDAGARLTINQGSKIFIHADAPFIVNGTLQVNGGKYDSTRVVFSGDRLDEPYRSFPGSYPGLFFTETSRDNVINYGIIKNAYQGIVAIESSAGTKLTLNETIIDNAYDAGLSGINTSITATNILVSNCGKNIVLVKGGNYNFTHCTVATFSNAYIQHKDPVLFVSNYLLQNNVGSSTNLNAAFRNCIFWGEGGGLVNSEVIVERKGGTNFTVLFDNVLWRVPNDPVNSVSTGTNIKNQNPQFDSTNSFERFYNFRLKNTSPAIDKGTNAGVFIDLDGNSRPVGLPDLGAYEKQ